MILITVAVIAVWYALASLSFPVSTDSLYFHLGLPKIFASHGRMEFIPGILFSASPRTSEMITTGFYFLGLERGAQLFIMLVAAIFVLTVWRRARDLGGYGGTAALLVLSVPIFVSQVTGSKNDFLFWGLSFFAGAKFISFIEREKAADLAWAGIGAGMAAGTKAIGLALFAPFAVILLYYYILGTKKLRHLFAFAALFALFALPWYLYSWAVTGNPVFPFFDRLFHSPYTTGLFESFNRELAIPMVSRTIPDLLASPFQLIFNPEIYDGRVGFALLLFPALLFFVRRISYRIKIALGVIVIFYLVWFFGFPFVRFLLPMLSLLAIAGSFFFQAALSGSPWLRRAAIFSLAVAVILPVPAALRDTWPRVRSVIDGTPRYEFLSGFVGLDPYQTQSGALIPQLPYIACWERLNLETPKGSRIGILTSFWTRSDGYYLDRGFVYLNPTEQRQFDFIEAAERPGDRRRPGSAWGDACRHRYGRGRSVRGRLALELNRGIRPFPRWRLRSFSASRPLSRVDLRRWPVQGLPSLMAPQSKNQFPSVGTRHAVSVFHKRAFCGRQASPPAPFFHCSARLPTDDLPA